MRCFFELGHAVSSLGEAYGVPCFRTCCRMGLGRLQSYGAPWEKVLRRTLTGRDVSSF